MLVNETKKFNMLGKKAKKTKYMERQIAFIDQKTQYGEGVNFPPKEYIGLMQFLSKYQQDFCMY